jgi:O-antigen ligase
MAILGTVLFALFFVLLAPKTRTMLGAVVAGAGDWIVKWAPYSYFLLMIVVIVPAIAAIVLIKWPQPPEPENPLARYKAAQDVIED